MKRLIRSIVSFSLSLAVFGGVQATINASEISPVKLYQAQQTEHVSIISLSDQGYQETYDNLYQAIKNLEPEALFPSDVVSYQEVGVILNKVEDDHPEIFYLNYPGMRVWSNGKVELSYKYTVEETKKMIQQLDEEVEEVLDQTIQPGDSDFDKVKDIHDYLVVNTAYDSENYDRGTIPHLSYTSYGLLLGGVAVCDGYAKAMKLLLEKAGVETHYVTGKAGGDLHAWNLVKVNGEYFYIDATWDDPVPDQKNTVRYKYFLVPASYLAQDHTWEATAFPISNSTRYSFFNEFDSMREDDGTYYYSNSADDYFLYAIAKDGTGKRKIGNVRTPYFVIHGDWIYFSNYSQGGYLSKMKLNGSAMQRLNETHSIDLTLQGNTLFYTEKATGTVKQLALEPLPAENPLEDKLPLFKKLAYHENIAANKPWKIQFSHKINKATMTSDTIYVLDEDGNHINVALDPDPEEQIVYVQPPANGYQPGKTYYLFIENIQSHTNETLKQPVMIQFHIAAN